MKIPDLTQVEDNPLTTAGAGVNRKKKIVQTVAIEPEIDPALINRKDNRFVWIGIGILLAILSLWAIS